MLNSLQFIGYKNFSSNELSGFEEFKTINLIIGKNNIGKSSLLDSVMALKIDKFNGFVKQTDRTIAHIVLGEDEIELGFPKNTSGGKIGGNHYNFGKNFIGSTFIVSLASNGTDVQVSSIDLEKASSVDFHIADDVFQQLITRNIKANSQMTISRLAADRNMVSEKATTTVWTKEDGSGVTNLIRLFLNKASYDGTKVKVDLLSALNKVMEGENFFEDILVQEISDDENSLWEVFLVEKDKGQIALSDSGSGLRTILLVLTKLILEKQSDIYIFEELENNLHPAIQRSLFSYMFGWIKEHKKMLFITSHSSVPINMLFKDEAAQIIHVRKEESGVIAKRASNFTENNLILDDLDIRGSDLLQANGIIWVEGPSDRVYINKWIQILSKGELIENKHYQILFYGGRLLSHLTAQSKEANDLINLLLANRNSIIVMDSDRTEEHPKINNTKARIKKEFIENGKFVWITAGKEIENYLPGELLGRIYGIEQAEFPTIGKKEKIDNYLNNLYKARESSIDGKNYTANKVRESKEIVSKMTLEDIQILDLKKQVCTLISEIKKWNHIN